VRLTSYAPLLCVLYTLAMEIKKYPYLDHHVRTEFVMFKVKEIMSSPVRVLHPVETVETIEKLLDKSSHYAFPVVDETTGRFLGLVRRDQLVALLQCGVFQETKKDRIPKHRRQRSVVDNPLHNLAFHIRDDRYNDDEYDEHAWLLDNITMSKKNMRVSLDDAFANRGQIKKRNRNVKVTKKRGKLVVYTDSTEKHLTVNIGAAMNQGAYCVTETCPVSKAYGMFTSLGLRHLVVLGGPSGGAVKGILTRSNFNLIYMEKRTGLDLGHK